VFPGSAKGGVLESHLASSRQQSSLKTDGWQAANAEEAKDAILSLNPDLCLIDICLKSYTSGIDMAEYVIEKLGIPVVVMSSDDHPTLPVPFVLKPICLPHLFAMINRALETPRF
jgi:DNA-binding NarL/FixJ family response regulator